MKVVCGIIQRFQTLVLYKASGSELPDSEAAVAYSLGITDLNTVSVCNTGVPDPDIALFSGGSQTTEDRSVCPKSEIPDSEVWVIIWWISDHQDQLCVAVKWIPNHIKP